MRILRQSFWQLIVIYVLTAALVTIKIVPRYALHFEIFAVIIAGIGALALNEKQSRIRTGWIVWLAVALIILFRIIPYLQYNIPIGYDAAFYTAAIDQYASDAVEQWFAGWSPPGLFMLTTIFTRFGIQTEVLLTTGVILLEILLGILIYLSGSTFFNRQAGALAMLLYSVSLAQYVTFELTYIKNILGISLLLAAMLFLHRKKYVPAVLTGVLVAGVQQPTFLLYGLCYLAHTATKIRDKKELFALVSTGAITLVAGILFYLQAIGPLFISATSNLINSTPGSFMSFTDYMFSTLPYLCFAFLGFLIALKSRKFNLLFYWFVINFVVVFLKLFFYNRFVIFLDVIFILYAGYAFSTILAVKRKLAIALIIAVVLSMAVTTGREALKAHPNISPEEYAFMKDIPSITEANSTLLSNMVEDAHWLEALSQRPVAAPGLFNAGKWTRNEWTKYWHAENFTRIQELMDRHPKPLYIYLGEKSPRGQQKKFETCTERVAQYNKMELLRYTC